MERAVKRKALPPSFASGFSLIRSPLYRFTEDIAVGGIIGSERVAAILNAEHYKRFVAVIAY